MFLRRIFIIALLVCPCVKVFSQADSAAKPLSFLDKNFFQSLGGTIFLNYGMTPFTYQPTTLHRRAANGRILYDSSGHEMVYDTIMPKEGEYETLLSVVYEPRLNLISYSDFFSVSLSTPVVFSVSFFDEGAFLLMMPAFVDLNFFNHSTYNNIDRYGFHLGAGRIFSFGPLITWKNPDLKTQLWSTWGVRAGLKFPYKDKNCFINATYGFGEKVDVSKVLDTRKFLREKLSFQLNFGMLINYE